MSMTPQEIREELFKLRDEKYRAFQAKLMPNIDIAAIIGVRTPVLRAFAKELLKNGGYDEFLDNLPHGYYDENNLHVLLLSGEKDYGKTIARLDRFLPYVDNWATCDMISPKAFVKNKTALLTDIDRYLASGQTYTVRFALEMLMNHFLDADFSEKLLQKAVAVKSAEYYVNMMLAWYFATALAKQWESTLPVLENRMLSVWVHNKTIQKAVESYRISDGQKAYLKTLKRQSADGAEKC